MHYNYFVIPLVTTLIGWLTNVVAVKMLFHPRKPINILGWRLHGVIPKRHDALAHSIADLFERELLSNDELATHLEQLEITDDVSALLDSRLTAAVTSLGAQIPMASMFLSDSMVAKISSKLKEEIVKSLPELKTRLAARVTQTLNLRALVESKILSFSVRKLEAIVLRVATRELRSIEVLGGVLGLLIGLAQVGLMALL